MNYTRDGWWSARMTLPWMQYSSQNNYLEEDKYQYRDNQTTNGWIYLYRSANNFKDIIDRCDDPKTSAQMSTYGNLKNQIAVSRIMLAYTFDNLVTHFGDVPYWSYGGKNNADFQALQIDKYVNPKYVTQEAIYKDLLNELKEAANQIDLSGKVFAQGDNIYNGDALAWKKFANSLRLRIANRIKHKLPEANTHISDAIAGGVFTSNRDNAEHAFGSVDAQGNPFWKTFYVDNRSDFFINQTFVELLKGEKSVFSGVVDPRLFKLAAPIGATVAQVKNGTYSPSSDLALYTGTPYGQPRVDAYYGTPSNINFFSSNYTKINKPEVLMEYSEVEFILSELEGWSQARYESGVISNLERWNVAPADIIAYVNALPAANKENVLTQKYITLLGNADESWNEYRRTGYPTGEVLLLPGKTGTRPNGTTYIFTPLQSGNVVATDLPARLRYPVTQQTLNESNWQLASSTLSNGDQINSKLYFAK